MVATLTPSDTSKAGPPKRPPRRRRRTRDGGWAAVFLGPQMVGLLVFVLGPMLFALYLSFTEWNGIGDITFVGLDNFRELRGDHAFWQSIRNTVWLAVMIVPGQLVTGLVVAVALHQRKLRTLYRIVYFMPVVTSQVAVSVIWIWLLNGTFGPLNSTLREWFGINAPDWLAEPSYLVPAIAMVTIWQGVGFFMVVFLAGLQGIPTAYLEAAEVDGAGTLRKFWHITLPLLTPTLFFLTIMSLIGAFQIFDTVYMMTPQNSYLGDSTRTIVFQIYDLAFARFDFGTSAAYAVVLFVLLLILTAGQLVLQRRWVHYEE
ncbi:sugar ABC transporter permease [Phytohabitans sp. ZYX-F-186]|uniref:Sugar ABC transporter permease n=1 Tax=Phytohabitans maris TaxID=3071409 RepID=A0ABU0ZVY9_9ACTN|nr:sugar ABC transporter permease [Phytohabitans sp. ZYX-F-186]MDQ7911205.1 sugar ABC transporter permease [Phytohabitans sp. ZYX-F-186]